MKEEIKGFTQVFRIDYENTFSPVARFETLHLLLSLAALHDWEIKALDVKITFLFAELDEKIYIEQPEGFVVKGQERMVCQPRKAIYGLTQAVLQAATQESPGDGIIHCKSDPETYFKIVGKKIIILLVYVTMLFLWAATRHKSFHTRKIS